MGDVQLTITCRYSCRLCGIKDAEVIVPVRDPAEDVRAWLTRVVGGPMRTDHNRRSPRCHPRSLHDVMIPIPSSAKRIGDPASH